MDRSTPKRSCAAPSTSPPTSVSIPTATSRWKSSDMLREEDLTVAVAEGIVTEPQAAALRALAQQRAKARAAMHGDDERFRFLRSFNDIFLTVGIALSGVGLAFFTAPTPARSLS